MARILVIDDEDPVRNMLRQVLERAGHEVAEAPDGNVGMQHVREQPIELDTGDFGTERGIERMHRDRHAHASCAARAVSPTQASVAHGAVPSRRGSCASTARRCTCG